VPEFQIQIPEQFEIMDVAQPDQQLVMELPAPQPRGRALLYEVVHHELPHHHHPPGYITQPLHNYIPSPMPHTPPVTLSFQDVSPTPTPNYCFEPQGLLQVNSKPLFKLLSEYGEGNIPMFLMDMGKLIINEAGVHHLSRFDVQPGFTGIFADTSEHEPNRIVRRAIKNGNSILLRTYDSNIELLNIGLFQIDRVTAAGINLPNIQSNQMQSICSITPPCMLMRNRPLQTAERVLRHSTNPVPVDIDGLFFTAFVTPPVDETTPRDVLDDSCLQHNLVQFHHNQLNLSALEQLLPRNENAFLFSTHSQESLSFLLNPRIFPLSLQICSKVWFTRELCDLLSIVYHDATNQELLAKIPTHAIHVRQLFSTDGFAEAVSIVPRGNAETPDLVRLQLTPSTLASLILKAHILNNNTVVY
jgi:hypothetical protein